MADYNPDSHFFVDDSNLSNAAAANLASDAFGPVSGSSTTKYRTTSFVRASALTKVFAICDGEIMIQPQTGEPTKVNLILKPAASAPYAPVKIKYFIYRGVNKSDLIDNNILVDVNESDPNQPIFLQKLWKHFIDFNMPFYEQGLIDTPPETFPAFLIGYDESQDGDILIEHYFKRNNDGGNIIFYQIPTCKRGEFLGNFTGRIGLDVVLDYGDYELTNQDELFRLDLNFARQAEHIFDIANIPNSTPIKIKRYKEYIHQFLDAAAFWGSHIECGKIRTISAPNGISSATDIFTNILNKYQTKNKLYFYIQAERTRTYNYYDDTRKVHGIDSAEILNDTNGWPIIIKEKTFSSTNRSLKIGLEYFIDPNIHPLNRCVSLTVLVGNNDLSTYPKAERPEFILGYVNKIFNYDISLLYDDPTITGYRIGTGTLPGGLSLTGSTGLISGTPLAFYAKQTLEFRADTPSGYISRSKDIAINPLIETTSIKFAFNGTKSCANFVFIFGDIIQESSPITYFNNLWPVNLGSTLSLPDNEINLTHWINFDRNQVKNFDDVLNLSASIQHKIIFDNGLNTSPIGPNPPTKSRRTYLAGMKNNTNQNPNYDTTSFTAAFEKQIPDTDNYFSKLFNDPNFIIYKGKFEDNLTSNVINCLSLFNDNDYTKKYSFFHLGITEEEFNKLIYDSPVVPPTPPYNNPPQLLPRDADNVFFFLEEATGFTTPNVKKFRLGLQYEDNAGALQILYPSTANTVHVYTIDGYLFCSPEYADYQPFFADFPKSKAEFRVTQPYLGEFGFDWMRIGDSGADGDVDYKNHIGKLYYHSNHNKIIIDSNEPDGFFKPNPQLYSKLELEYTPFPTQFDNSNEIHKYYVPKITIYPTYQPVPTPGIDLDTQSIFGSTPDLVTVNRIAKVSLNISITNPPQNIDFLYDSNVLELHNLSGQINTQTDGVYDINITSKISFGTPQIVKVLAHYGNNQEVIGLLIIKPNHRSLRYSKKLLFVDVITNISGQPAPIPLKFTFTQHALHLKQFLRQIHTTPQFDSEVIDFVTNPDSKFDTDYVGVNSVGAPVIIGYNQHTPASPYDVVDYLYNTKLVSEQGTGSKYDKHFKIFFFHDVGGKIDSAGNYSGLSGYSNGTDKLVDFPNTLPSTTTHEFLHTANVQHTFAAYEASKFAKFTYQSWKTDNILDYSDIGPNPRFPTISLFEWQGEIAKKEFDPEP